MLKLGHTLKFSTIALLGTLLAAPALALAEKPAPAQQTVNYQAVDSSTLRVFAIGTVGLETFTNEQDRQLIYVATPDSGHGTGFMVGNDGLLLTAQHVVDGARHVVVRLPGKDGFTPARVVHSNKKEDIAVLSIEEPIAAIELGDDKAGLQVRQTIFAIGYPMDPSRKQAQSARGIVAGALENGTVQLDIAVNPGNSGGPLVDESNRVVGMIVARGDVENGVQGMGFAVPLNKLTVALAKARKKIAKNGVEKLSAQERRSAGVVDELIQRGALHVLTDRKDLDSTINQKKLVEDLQTFTATIEDADLLAFVGGNLWNAHLIIKYGGVTKIGGTELSQEALGRLAYDLRDRALKLAYRAHQQDATVAKRSEYVRFAMRFFPDESRARLAGGNNTASERLPNPRANLIVERSKPAPLLKKKNREFGARLSGSIRWSPETRQGAAGASLASFVRFGLRTASDGKAQTFAQVGPAISRVRFDAMEGEALQHTFYALEAGLLHRLWQHSGNHLQLGVFWSPSYYKSEVISEGPGTDTVIASASEFALLHTRVSLGFQVGAAEFTAAVRILSGPTWWFEPVSVGFSF